MEERNRKEINIMVIDDSDLNRKSVVNILDEAGYNIAGEASNAEEAMKALGSVTCNIFIIDIVMPEVSGLDIAKKLTEILKDSNIIMMSSLTSEHIVIDSISSGAVDFLQKPFTKKPDDLCVHKIHPMIFITDL